jgi:SP family general alpha glucoside:H+ symporter-like MFS transporter
MSAVGLQRLNKLHPFDFRLAIYTQWGMIGGLALIYCFLPESPWWLIGKDKTEKARKTLLTLKGGVPGYDVDSEIAVMQNTITEQRHRAGETGKMPMKRIFMGLNGKRLIIALWPKLCQQFVGLSVFNNYATYFCEMLTLRYPMSLTSQSRLPVTKTRSWLRSFYHVSSLFRCASRWFWSISGVDDR